uniref:Uncharacterized protein n=1 Tax=Melanopsichium pennsylvanicum 4 TaxID=1398559 RepID=A0A077RBH9_9BASI|nr:uncharacterized protein BN887_03422 [Melanopsichium pennsylvanicum 4]
MAFSSIPSLGPCVERTGVQVNHDGFEGLSEKMYTYPGIDLGAQSFIDRFLRERQVHFIHGSADVGMGDERAQAMAQGANRVERAQNYQLHLDQMAAKIGVRGKWTVDWVAGVGHDGRSM